MIMMIEIREIKDARMIIEFGREAGLEDINQWIKWEKLQQFLDSNVHVAFGAFSLADSKLVGMIVGGFEEEGRLWIEALAVHPSWRKKGIGRTLIQKLEKIGKQHDYRALFVDVDDDNYEGLAFYRKIGFIDVGFIKYYYHDGANAIILFKPFHK